MACFVEMADQREQRRLAGTVEAEQDRRKVPGAIEKETSFSACSGAIGMADRGDDRAPEDARHCPSVPPRPALCRINAPSLAYYCI